MKTELVNIKNLKEFAKNIYDNLGGKNILLLRGNLGSGKTTFVRNFCEILDIENDFTSVVQKYVTHSISSTIISTIFF